MPSFSNVATPKGAEFTENSLQIPRLFALPPSTLPARSMKVAVWITTLLLAFSLSAQNGFRIQGKVTGIPAGLTDGFLRVILGGRSFNQPIVAPVRADGSFEFNGVPSGTVSINEGMLRALPISVVVDRDIQGVTLTVPPRLVGEIVTESGKPLPADENVQDPAFRLELRGQKSGLKRPFFLHSDGTFAFSPELPQDEYEIRVPVMPKGYSVKSITYGGAELAQARFKTTGKDFSFLRITLATPAPTPDSATLIMTQGGRGPIFIEGAFAYFEVRSTGPGGIRQKTRLGGQACTPRCPAGLHHQGALTRHLSPSLPVAIRSPLIAGDVTATADDSARPNWNVVRIS
jgi:hypothetical protein